MLPFFSPSCLTTLYYRLYSLKKFVIFLLIKFCFPIWIGYIMCMKLATKERIMSSSDHAKWWKWFVFHYIFFMSLIFFFTKCCILLKFCKKYKNTAKEMFQIYYMSRINQRSHYHRKAQLSSSLTWWRHRSHYRNLPGVGQSIASKISTYINQILSYKSVVLWSGLK